MRQVLNSHVFGRYMNIDAYDDRHCHTSGSFARSRHPVNSTPVENGSTFHVFV